ncbi:MAG TPA: site-specific integrase [Terriglobales bacterium]|nr:site-specific integrase [Terriglobales bacterium]
MADLVADLIGEQKANGNKAVGWTERRWNLHLKPFFEHYRAVDITRSLVNRYIGRRQKDGAAVASINREVAVLSAAFHLGVKNSKIRQLPLFPRLKERNTRTGFLEDAQYQALADACGKVGLWLRAIFEVGYCYGWRKEEVLGLRCSQVNLLDRTIRLNPGETKNEEGREAPLAATLYPLLAECMRNKGAADPVFTREDGEAVKGLRPAWDNACVAAGVGQMVCDKCGEPAPDKECECGNTDRHYEGLIFHDLRRTAVRNMVRSGIPEQVAMRISGHKTRSVFDRYHIVSQADVREAVAKLDSARENRYSLDTFAQRKGSGKQVTN